MANGISEESVCNNSEIPCAKPGTQGYLRQKDNKIITKIQKRIK